MARWQRRFQSWYWLGAASGIASGVVSLALAAVPAIGGLETWAYDGYIALRGVRPSPANIVIVALDERSLDDLAKPLIDISPELAEVVQYLKSEGAAAVGIDLIIPERFAGRPEVQRHGSGDATLLGRAILEVGNVVLGQWKVDDAWFRTLPQWRLKSTVNAEPGDVGFVNVTEDNDYFLRRQQLYVRDGESGIPHLALAMLCRARHQEIAWRQGELRLGERAIPLDRHQRLLVNFRGPPHTFPVIPFAEVRAAAREDRSLSPNLNDAMVLIGVTAATQQDFHATPFANNFFRYWYHAQSGMMSGTEWHANVLSTLADEAYFTATPPWVTAVLVLAVGAALGIVYARVSLWVGLLIAVVFHLAWKAIGAAALAYADCQIPVISMLLVGALGYAATFAVRWRRVRGILAVMNAKAIADALDADLHGAAIPAEERVVSVLFADIRSFTTFSETHGPAHVVDLLNTYFSLVVPIIERHGGVLNQYMGDGVMVIFGAPRPQQDHALRAVETATAMVAEVHARHDLWRSLGYAEMRIGVGVHTGPAILGTVGSEQRRDYTAIGDTVNTAARIEAENKRLATEILISDETLARLRAADRLRLRCSDSPMPAKLKGKSKEVRLFEVKAMPSSAEAETA
jgi:adenylate cyclase